MKYYCIYCSKKIDLNDYSTYECKVCNVRVHLTSYTDKKIGWVEFFCGKYFIEVDYSDNTTILCKEDTFNNVIDVAVYNYTMEFKPVETKKYVKRLLNLKVFS